MGLPLEGLRVIDLTQDFAGPFCTMMLSDLGAEVVKIEKPDGGDETRSWGPPWINGTSYYFQALNRGKKSVVLDLKKPEDQKKVRKLVVDADIFVESSQPGRMARFNLDYARLRRINNALVYASISSFGQTGPYRDRLGYDLIAFAMSGIMASTGEQGRPPIRMSVPVADLAAGHYTSTAILAALSRRLVTGRGDYIDLSLHDSIVSWLTYQANYYFATGKEPRRLGSAHPSIVPYQAFRCKDKEMVLAIGNDHQWTNFCHATGQEKLIADRRFSTNPARVKNRHLLIPVLQRMFRRKDAKEWQMILDQVKVPATPAFSIRDLVHDAHARYRKMIVKSEGDIPRLGSPIRFRKTKPKKTTPAPRLGQHTKEIMAKGWPN
ncbi:MAG TPA: CoA transferase [Candidatus Bathyarchaeia archaeon]|nr:CoA transferase [Candidatus Bathyarchaeia archaeon]